MSSKREREQKRRLQHFLNDLALVGSLQGFKYFQPWLRGKEELLLTVVNEDSGWRSPGFAVSRASSCSSSSCSTSSSSSEASPSGGGAPRPGGGPPGPEESRVQTPPRMESEAPSRHGNAASSQEHLLPASPSEAEMAVPEVHCTLFLLAGYVRYGRPYAWIRSNHERLVTIGGADSMVRDTPMRLRSVSDWQTRGVRVWDVVAELVSLCTVPPPSNPFALDTRYLKGLPPPERLLVTGALLSFLETYLVYGNRDELHYDKVVEEAKPLRRLHVGALLETQRLRGGPAGPPDPPGGDPQNQGTGGPP